MVTGAIANGHQATGIGAPPTVALKTRVETAPENAMTVTDGTVATTAVDE
jgi:hypothetical protein